MSKRLIIETPDGRRLSVPPGDGTVNVVAGVEWWVSTSGYGGRIVGRIVDSEEEAPRPAEARPRGVWTVVEVLVARLGGQVQITDEELAAVAARNGLRLEHGADANVLRLWVEGPIDLRINAQGADQVVEYLSRIARSPGTPPNAPEATPATTTRGQRFLGIDLTGPTDG